MRNDLKPFIIFLLLYLGLIGFQYYKAQAALGEIRDDTQRVNRTTALMVKRDCINFLWAHRLHYLEMHPNDPHYHSGRLFAFTMLEYDYRHNECR